MEYTIKLFRKMYEELPPLFPSETKRKMGFALQRAEKGCFVEIESLEQQMIDFGLKAWPWVEAYREFLLSGERKLGDHFLIPKLSKETAKRFRDFKIFGGTIADLHSGRPAEFFSTDERNEISKALVEFKIEMRRYTDREITVFEKNKYLKRVKELDVTLEQIKNSLENLSNLANEEADHEVLALEIRQRVRRFELSLCYLGPSLNIEEIEKSLDFFKGRKSDLNRLKTVMNF